MADYSEGLWEVQDDGTIIVESKWFSGKKNPYIGVMSITEKKKMVPHWIRKDYDNERKYYMATFILSPSEVPDGSIVKFQLASGSWKNDAIYYAKIDRSYYTNENKRPYKDLIGRTDAKNILWNRLKKARKETKSGKSVVKKSEVGKTEAEVKKGETEKVGSKTKEITKRGTTKKTEKTKTETKKTPIKKSKTKTEESGKSEKTEIVIEKWPSGVKLGARDSREIRILSSEPDLSEIKGVGPSITQAVTDIYGTTSVSELLKVDGFLESLGDIRTDSGRKIPKSTLNNIKAALNLLQT